MLVNPPERAGWGGVLKVVPRCNGILGSMVERTSVWEASKIKSRYCHPDNLPHSLCPDLLFLHQY